MSAGILTDQHGQQISVASNSCADAKTGYNAFFTEGQATPLVCSSDPVVPGSVITFSLAGGGGTSAVVFAMSATANTGEAPNSINCSGACTVVIQHEFNIPLLQMSAADGAQIGFAIVLVWVVGFGIRMVLRAMDIGFQDASKEAD